MGVGMDPVTLIATALIAGAASGTTDTTASAVREIYTRLWGMVRRRTVGHPNARTALDTSRTGAPDRLDLLKTALWEVGAGTDAQLVTAAQELMELVDPDGARQGKYVVVRDAKNVVVGDHNIQIIHP